MQISLLLATLRQKLDLLGRASEIFNASLRLTFFDLFVTLTNLLLFLILGHATVGIVVCARKIAIIVKTIVIYSYWECY